jgi:Flp pilus assembly protein TadG
VAPRRKDEAGTSIIELALVIWVFFTIVFGAIDVGYAFVVKENMTHAMEEGLRAALTTPNSACTGSVLTATCEGQYAMTQARSRMSSFSNYGKAEGVMVVGSSLSSSPNDTAGQCDTSGGSSGGALDICTNVTGGALQPCPNGADGTCLQMTLAYDYKDNSVVNMPLIDLFIPSQIRVTGYQRMS